MYPKKLTEITAIGNDDIGTVYLEKRYYLSVGERREIQECASSNKKLKLSVGNLIKKVAKDKNISSDEAQSLIFTQEIDGIGVEKDRNIVYEYAEDFADIQHWAEIASLSEAEQITTIFLKYRCAYPIIILSDAGINDVSLDILVPDFSEEDLINLKDKSVIRFGGIDVIVKGNHAANISNITVEPIYGDIASGAVGFLMLDKGKRYALGLEKWDSGKTKTLHEDLAPLVYEFYQNERTGWVKPEPAVTTGEDETEGESLKLTGTDSTGESSPTESATPDLVAGSVS